MSKSTLLKMVTTMFVLGLCLFAYVLLRPLDPAPSTTHREIDLSLIRPGELKVIEGLDLPVWVLHRTPAMMASLKTVEHLLQDSKTLPGLPARGEGNMCQTEKPEFFVFFPAFEIINKNNGVHTYLTAEREISSEVRIQGKYYPSGFKDTAGKELHFDYAGRLLSFKAQSYWLKSVSDFFIPDCSLVSENKLLINIESFATSIGVH